MPARDGQPDDRIPEWSVRPSRHHDLRLAQLDLLRGQADGVGGRGAGGGYGQARPAGTQGHGERTAEASRACCWPPASAACVCRRTWPSPGSPSTSASDRATCPRSCPARGVRRVRAQTRVGVGLDGGLKRRAGRSDPSDGSDAARWPPRPAPERRRPVSSGSPGTSGRKKRPLARSRAGPTATGPGRMARGRGHAHSRNHDAPRFFTTDLELLAIQGAASESVPTAGSTSSAPGQRCSIKTE